MIEFFKENYQWIGAIFVPVVVAIIGAIAVLAKNGGRNQKMGDIHGNGNAIINGDVKKRDDIE